MTLVSRILHEKRTLVTIVTLILALDLGLYAFAVYPWLNKVSQAQTQAAAAEGRLADAKTGFASVSQTSSDKTNADNQLRRFYDDVLPRDLAGARSISASFLTRLADDTNLVLERRTSDPEKDRESLLARLRTTMVLAGEYEDIRQFIYELESASEFILIEEVLLSQAAELGEGLVLTLGVSTYYWAGSDAAS